jgi:hypothetical protein
MLRIGRAVIVATLLVAPAAWAQGPGSTFGAIVGGASLSDFGGDYGGSSSSRWGGTAGLLLGYNAWRTSVTLEGDWVQKGGEDTRLDYIEFPLTVGAIAVTGGGAMRARIYSGISFGFKVSCSSDLNVSGISVCDDASGTEWGWPFGLQLAKVNENNSFVGLDVKYTVALSDAFDAIDAYNRPWQFRLMFGKLLGTSAGY